MYRDISWHYQYMIHHYHHRYLSRISLKSVNQLFFLSQLTIGSLGEGGHHTQILVPNHCIIISCHLIISYQNNPLIEGGYHTQILGTITSSCHHIILYNLYCWSVFRHEFSDINYDDDMMMWWWCYYVMMIWWYDYNDDMMMTCLVSFPDWWTVGTPLVIVSSLPASPRASPSLKASLYLSPWHISTVLLIWWWLLLCLYASPSLKPHFTAAMFCYVIPFNIIWARQNS